MNALYNQKYIEGLEIMVLFGADAAGGEPTLQRCGEFADAQGVNRAKVFIDHDFQTAFTHVDGGSAALPWDGVINGRNMRLEWNDTQGGTPLQKVEELLAGQ